MSHANFKSPLLKDEATYSLLLHLGSGVSLHLCYFSVLSHLKKGFLPLLSASDHGLKK